MKHLILLAFLGIFSFSVSGQNIDYLSNGTRNATQSRGTTQSPFDQTYIPSPEAYAMAQYVETPISYYTGIPDISIPLYTIKVGEFELPISLKYHASGIKVAQEASRVGLGWSLHAGGEITRVIQDRDDIHVFWDDYTDCRERGYWIDSTSYRKSWKGDLFSFDENGKYYYDNADYPECVDSEPDIFYFNFCGYQGTFYAKKGAGIDSSIKEKWLLQNKETGLHIDYFYDGGDPDNDSEGHFVVTSLDGTKYTFNGHNKVLSCGSCWYEADNTSVGWRLNLGTYYNPNGSVLHPVGGPQDTVITSWYLTEIELVSGEKITFGYDEESYYSPLYEKMSVNSEIRSEYVNPVFETQKQEISNRKLVRESLFHSMSATLVYHQHVLKKITWEGGCIEFSPGSIRRDVRKVPEIGSETHSEYDSHTLSEVRVCSLVGTQKSTVSTYKLHHSYFGGREDPNDTESYFKLRLRLDSISVYGDGNASQKYRMAYNMDCGLPEKYSDMCDKWGYNAKNSRPYYEIYTALTTWPRYKNWKPDFIEAGARFVSTIPTAQYPAPESAKAWVLTELTTPTGGTTRYTYEGNTINEEQVLSMSNIQEVMFTSDRKTVSISPSEISDSDTQEFTLDISTDCGFIDLHCYCEAGTSEHLTSTDIFTIYGADGRMLYIQTGIPSNAKVEHYSMTLYSFNTSIPIHKKGQYKIILPKNREWIKKVELTCKEIKAVVKNTTVATGGLRIKKIESPVGTRCFTYLEDSISSGQLNRSPIYAHPRYWMAISNLGYLLHVDYYLQFSSAPCQPLANLITGGYMGYSRVQELVTDDSGKTVKKEYYFYNQKEQTIGEWYDKGSTPPLNGRPSMELLYDKNGEMLKKTLFDYREAIHGTICGRAHSEDSYAPSLYHWYCYETQLSTKKEITRGTDDGICDTLSVCYAYDSACRLPSSILTKSAYTIKEERMTYSSDYDYGVWNTMKSRNLLSLPVEKSIYMDNTLVGRSVLLYSPSCLYKPYKEFSYTGRESSTPEVRDMYNMTADYTYTYSDCGRLVQVTSRTGRSMVLLWGYNRQYVIAQIMNATLEDIRKNGIDPQALANKPSPTDADWAALDRLRSKLPESEVITCKFLPLIGMIERTDGHGRTTVYTYDDFSRLENIKEVKNGQPVPVLRYEYHLQTEK